MEGLPEVVVGRQTWTLNTGQLAFHDFPELEGEMLHIQILVCAGVSTHIRVHMHALTFAFTENENTV